MRPIMLRQTSLYDYQRNSSCIYNSSILFKCDPDISYYHRFSHTSYRRAKLQCQSFLPLVEISKQIHKRIRINSASKPSSFNDTNKALRPAARSINRCHFRKSTAHTLKRPTRGATTFIKGIGIQHKDNQSFTSKKYNLLLYDNNDELFSKFYILVSIKGQSMKFCNVNTVCVSKLKDYFDKALTRNKTFKTHDEELFNAMLKEKCLIYDSHSTIHRTRREKTRREHNINSHYSTQRNNTLERRLINAKKLRQSTERELVEKLIEDTQEQFDINQLIKVLEVYALPDTLIVKYKNQSLNIKTTNIRDYTWINRMKANKVFMISKVSSLSGGVNMVKSNTKKAIIMATINDTKTRQVKDLREEEGRNEKELTIKHRVNIKDTSVEHKCGIKILHKDFTHHKNHNINKMIENINKFIEITFKNKEGNYKVAKCILLANAIGIPLLRGDISDQTFKNKDNSNTLKEKILRRLWSVLNAENGVNSLVQGKQYKFCVCGNNNPTIIKSLLKSRGHWNYAEKSDEDLNFLWTQWANTKFIQSLPKSSSNKVKMCNHLERHGQLSNKKNMFINLVNYYNAIGENPYLTLPLTFHIKQGLEDQEFIKFCEKFQSEEGKNTWIIKPGEYTNQGRKIQVVNTLDSIKKVVKAMKKGRSFIIQKYIEQPLLINKRKFDIRMYALFTSINGHLKGYFYEEGYIRTSSKEFSLKNLSNRAIHLTNDAVQQKEEDYGRFESGNKLSFTDFQKYLDTTFKYLNINFLKDLLPQIKKIITDTFRSVYNIIDPYKRHHAFEIFGYDFMIDTKFNIYLIEVNTNPCIEFSSPLLGRLITNMLNCALK